VKSIYIAPIEREIRYRHFQHWQHKPQSHRIVFSHLYKGEQQSSSLCRSISN